MSEKFSLKWNDFQSNVSRTLSQLRSEAEFFDVSLVSDDEKMMSAHKLVLSASSPYFKHILTTNKHSHPLLCLDGVSSAELQCVLDYIYQGEVQIYQEQLDRFLVVAQRLQLEGLIKEEPDVQETLDIKSDYDHSTVDVQMNNRSKKREIKTQRSRKSDDPVIVSIDTVATNIALVDAKIMEYIVKNQDGSYTCLRCGKKSGIIGHAKSHVETHMEGLSFPCQSCDKTFRSRNSLSFHKSKYHRSY